MNRSLLFQYLRAVFPGCFVIRTPFTVLKNIEDYKELLLCGSYMYFLYSKLMIYIFIYFKIIHCITIINAVYVNINNILKVKC